MKKTVCYLIILSVTVWFSTPLISQAQPVPPPPPHYPKPLSPHIHPPPPRPVPPPPRRPIVPPPVVIPGTPPPTVIAPPSITSGRVLVTVPALKVRSGPGTQYPAIGTVWGDMVLNVYGLAPDWVYVMTPSGGFGWLSERYINWVRIP